jgi:acetylornithine deacetylase/succinyl-diaminopimelate desuccinylase-like protein
MIPDNLLPDVLSKVQGYISPLQELREIVLANTIMCAEIAAPTFGEADLVRFLCDRFTESDLQNISTDEMGNAIGVIPGSLGKDAKNILVAAHVDNIWESGVDHTASVGANAIHGPGVADNSLGAATIATLPIILKRLGIELEHNLVLLGATRSMGRGNLAGLSFFVDNTSVPIDSALCIEGIDLGRLSYSCLGMNRCEILVETPEIKDWQVKGLSTTISELTRIVQRILAIPIPSEPKTSIILGSLNAGSGYNVPPTFANLRFEIRSEMPGMVATIREQILEIIEEANAEQRVKASLEILAHRQPGSIGFSHPLVKATREIMGTLGLKPKIAPSTSELSVLLNRDIPSLTLGVTKGCNKHNFDEAIEIEPIFTGLAQIVGVLQFIDGSLNHE